MSEDIVLKTTDLTKHYGGVHALEGANFELRKGEHVAIMGDNGAGKSTFVRQITGWSNARVVPWCSMAQKGIFPARLRRGNLALKPCFKLWLWPITWMCPTISFWDGRKQNGIGSVHSVSWTIKPCAKTHSRPWKKRESKSQISITPLRKCLEGKGNV